VDFNRWKSRRTGTAARDGPTRERVSNLLPRDNGLLFDRIEGLEIRDVHFVNVTNFAILASRSTRIRMDRIEIADSGSRDSHKRNNTTGGILIEEGAR